MRRVPILVLALALAGCTASGLLDFDGDGIPDAVDCAPEDPERGAALDPFGDDIDQNCDGVDGVDRDLDGYASEDDGGPDCNDADPDVHPGAEEGCDGQDTDCDGEIDVDELDVDGDGQSACAGDCDEEDAGVHSTQEEACNGLDDDCDGYVPSNERDLDGDGFQPCAGDCNDAIASIHPGAEEVCNTFDDDCDGVLPVDETDADGDGQVPCQGDCEDGDADVYRGNGLWDDPNDGLDSNCDGHDANDLSSAAAWLDGGDDFDHAGVAACGVGDVDGDGLDDVLIGGNLSDAAAEASGEAWLVLGGSTTPGEQLIADRAFATFAGVAQGDRAGWSVAPAGDVDGDGLDDILIGAYGDATLGPYTGATHLFLGADLAGGGEWSLADAHATFRGEQSYDESGWAFAGIGDVDGDGLSDLLFGAYDNDESAVSGGKVYLFYAASVALGGEYSLDEADSAFLGVTNWEEAGYWVDGGDFDGDGLADLLIGAPYADDAGEDSGRVYVVLAASIAPGTTSLASADTTFFGAGSGGYAGRRLQVVGDVDGDGAADALVGAGFLDDPFLDGGAAYLLTGPTLAMGGVHSLSEADVTFLPEGPNDRAGGSVGAPGDVDGDGLDDLLIGAFGNDEGGQFSGKAYLVLATTAAAGSVFELADADAAFVGEEPGDSIGQYLCRGGDLDGDGYSDLVLGSWKHSSSFVEAGRTYLLPSVYADAR